VGAETNSPLPAQRQVQGGARKAISYQYQYQFFDEPHQLRVPERPGSRLFINSPPFVQFAQY